MMQNICVCQLLFPFHHSSGVFRLGLYPGAYFRGFTVFLRTITWDRRSPFTSNFIKCFIYLRRLSCYEGLSFMQLVSYDLPPYQPYLSSIIQFLQNFLKCYQTKRNFITYTYSLTKQKSFGSLLSLYFQIFYQRYYLIKLFFKMHQKNSTRLGFR